MDRQQREYFLNQQMRTIQEELGGNPIENEIKDIPPNIDIKKKIYRSYEIPIHFEISNHFFDKSKKN